MPRNWEWFTCLRGSEWLAEDASRVLEPLQGRSGGARDCVAVLGSSLTKGRMSARGIHLVLTDRTVRRFEDNGGTAQALRNMLQGHAGCAHFAGAAFSIRPR